MSTPEPAAEAPAGRLPRGPHRLPRDVVALNQRTRMLDAMVCVVAEKGYRGATVADVIRQAGVSRTTFYQQFADREACFLAAYEECARRHYERVLEAMEEAGVDPLARLHAGVRAYLQVLVENPGLARTFLLEIAAVGDRAIELHAEAQARYVRLVRLLPPALGLPAVPDSIIFAATAAIDQLVMRAIREDADLAALEPDALFITHRLLGIE